MKKSLYFLTTFLFAVMVAGAETVKLSDTVRAQIKALQDEKASRTPAQQKMDSHLIFAVRKSLKQPFVAGVPTLRNDVKLEQDGRVTVDIDAKVSDSLLQSIKNAGGTVVFSSVKFHSLRAILPLAKLEQIAQAQDLKSMKYAVPVMTHIGSVTSEGDKTHQADQARARFGVDGTGIKVGVLSDSVDYLAASQATGDLPPNVTVLSGRSGIGPRSTGEGTAMLEIIHDLAPGAQLFFSTGDGGPAQFAQNILDLQAAGCNIIVDDLGYADESPFQDGIVAQAVNTVTAEGVLYFSSAGNEGNKDMGTSGTWAGDFVDGGAATAPVDVKGGVVHSFGTLTYDTVTKDSSSWAVLFWSDPLGASTNDYDLYVLDSTGSTIVDSSTMTQNGRQDPVEIVSAPITGERIVIVKASGEARFLHLENARGELAISTEGNTRGHCAATNAFCVAAIDANNSYPNAFTSANSVEPFSSDGPRKMFYQADGTPYTPGNFLASGGIVRQKPDIAAADGVSTSVPGFLPFYGTSAAAPHAAAIAALLESYNPTLTPDQIRTVLAGTSLDNMAAGWDRDAGAGIVMALPLLTAAPLPPPMPRFAILTNIVSGGNGNGRIDYDECNDLTIVVTNTGTLGSTNLHGILSSTTPGVFIAQPSGQFPDMPAAVGLSSNSVPFSVSTSPDFIPGVTIDFTLVLKCDQIVTTNYFQVATGTKGVPIQFHSITPVLIPDGDLAGITSSIPVANINGALSKATVSVYIAHPYALDLKLALIAPDGTSITLADSEGFGEASAYSYGFDCDTNSATTFDDDALRPISLAFAPFYGSYKPEEPLSSFIGKYGTNLNGEWKLQVTDQNTNNLIGALECWSLTLTPFTGTDGGGECPGVDLSVAMSAAPSPVPAGSILTYSLLISNAGPSSANSASLVDNLPADCTFVSADLSQGSYFVSGNLLSCSLGLMPPGQAATIVVKVIPNKSETISSTATVGSTSTDINTANNWVTLSTQVTAPRSDLSLTMTANPNPVLAGGVLTYTVGIVNYGPSTASNIVVTNFMAPSVTLNSVSVSQGTYLPSANTILALIGSIPLNGTASIKISVTPNSFGQITASAIATSDQSDPLQNNNRASVTTTVSQAADLAVSIVAQPNPILVSGLLTYSVTVTNMGPGDAQGVKLLHYLPSNVSLQSAVCGTNFVNSSVSDLITVDLPTLPAGGSAILSVIVQVPNQTITLASSATVSALLQDPDTANNSASCKTVVAPPFVNIQPAGTSLISESITPTNGVIDLNERVTVRFWLQNAGTITASNVTATLLSGGGVASPSSVTGTNYGDLASGQSTNQDFAFTAVGTNGLVIASMRIVTTTNVFTNTFTFTLPTTVAFSNTNQIVIPLYGLASPYPSTNLVSGITDIVEKVTATLNNFTHTHPQDVSVLLVSPTGRQSILMAHAGGRSGSSVTNISLTFDDGAATQLPASRLISGSFKPAGYAVSYSPLVTFTNMGPFETNMTTFAGADPNGIWSLYVIDDSSGDLGAIASGWSLAITTIPTANNVADIALTTSCSTNRVIVGQSVLCTFSITNNGPNVASKVAFTNMLPAGLAFDDGTTSFVTNFNLLPSGSSLNFMKTVRANASGTFKCVNSAFASELDLNLLNNTSIATIESIIPTANLGVSISGPTNITTLDDLTYCITVTNAGPNNALNVLLTNIVPAGILPEFPSDWLGTWSTNTVVSGGVTNLVLLCNLGTIVDGSVTNVSWMAKPLRAMSVTNTVTISTASTNLNSDNNVASMVTTVNDPMPLILPAGTRMISENGTKNNAIDPGETVTVLFSLENIGARATTNLIAKIEPNSGIISDGQPALFGAIGTNMTKSCAVTFTAVANTSNAVVVTFDLSDQGASMGSVTKATFTFQFPAQNTFFSPSAIVIPEEGPASPYPSTISVSGVTGLVSQVIVTLNSITHSFPRDINAMLVSPAGQKLVLMSRAGDHYSLNGVTLIFTNSPAQPLPSASQIYSGLYLPSNYGGNFIYPGDPSTTSVGGLEGFSGIDPTGSWSLYVYDNNGGDFGIISQGWNLTLNTYAPLPKINPVPADLSVSHDNNSFQLLINGQSGMSYSVQTSSDLVNWQTLPAAVAGTDGKLNVDLGAATNSARFYRVISLP